MTTDRRIAAMQLPTDPFSRTLVQMAAGADLIGRTMTLAVNNADRYALLELEAQPTVTLDGQPGWIDTRPMLDEREVPPQVIDIHQQVLAYATSRGLITHSAAQPHMVRLVRMGA